MKVAMAMIEVTGEPIHTITMWHFKRVNSDTARRAEIEKRIEGLVPVADYERAVWDFYALGSVRFAGPLDVHAHNERVAEHL